MVFILSPVALAPCVRAAPPEELAADQAVLAMRYARLETLAKRLAELNEAEDPARAEQLRAAIRKSQELALRQRFEAIVELLEEEQLAAAAGDQGLLADQLRQMLDLLLADPERARDEARRKALAAALKTLDGQIRTQRQLRAESDRGPGARSRDADRQQALAKQAGELGKRVAALDPSPTARPPRGAPPDAGTGRPASPEGQAADRIDQARRHMIEAAAKLSRVAESRSGDDTAEQQLQAQRRLEEARELLEQALRQVREEELRRRLARLATRLRRMLTEQKEVLDLTRQAEGDRPNRGRRATRVAALGLANREVALVKTADGVLRLLREDGGSLAFPEIIGQIREDLQAVATRLGEVKLAGVTQQLEQDVIDSLSESIESLDRTIEELEQRKADGRQGQPGGQPGEPPLVDTLAELRMIRALQARILRKTEFWDRLRKAEGRAIQSDSAAAPERQLERLAERQQRLIEAIRKVGDPPSP